MWTKAGLSDCLALSKHFAKKENWDWFSALVLWFLIATFAMNVLVNNRPLFRFLLESFDNKARLIMSQPAWADNVCYHYKSSSLYDNQIVTEFDYLELVS